MNQHEQAMVDLELEQLIAEFEALSPGPGLDDEHLALLHKYVRMWVGIDAELERVKANTEAMLETLARKKAALESRYSGVAREIAKRMLAGKKVKSITTPWGKAGFRATPASINVVDEPLFMLSNPQFVREIPAKKAVDKTALNEAFKKGGDIPAGCDAVPAGEKFYVQ